MSVLRSEPEVARVAAEVLKSLAHPIRLRLVALLVERDHNVTELAQALDEPQAIVSQQLRILRMHGLVKAARENGFARYALAEPGLRNIVDCIESCAFCRRIVAERQALRPAPPAREDAP